MNVHIEEEEERPATYSNYFYRRGDDDTFTSLRNSVDGNFSEVFDEPGKDNAFYAEHGKDNAEQVDDGTGFTSGNYVYAGSIPSGAITAILIPPAADAEQQRRVEEERQFQLAYTAAMSKHSAGVLQLNEPVPSKHEGNPFCLNCVLYPVVLPKMGCRGPLRNVALDQTQLRKLHTLFNEEVANPTVARAHIQATKGQSCPIFAPRSRHFSIPQDDTWGKLRQWHDQAKKPKP
jgi:hypothetical protein